MSKTGKMSFQTQWEQFIQLCAQLKTPKQFSDFFNLCLTRAEQEDIAVRYGIIQALLSGGKSQRDIAKRLGVSIAKITRGSNALRIADQKIKKLFT